MSELELYLCFRKELDSICVSEILKQFEVTKIEYDGKTVGILCAVPDYIDCIYILPEYRRKGLAKKSVLEFWNKHSGYDMRLHIINKNEPALRFWNGIFELQLLAKDNIDGLYRIVKAK